MPARRNAQRRSTDNQTYIQSVAPNPTPYPIAFFDPLSGVSGDMALGALIDAGVPGRIFTDLLLALPIDNVRIETSTTEQYGLRGTQVRVTDTDPHPPHRHLSDIRDILRDSNLPAPVQERALAVFTTLAEAEAQVHGTRVEEVHFHEVGAVDAIVDVVGTVVGLDWLGVQECYCGPLPLPFGGGLGRSAHGPLPLPGPATVQILAAAQAPTRPRDTDRELVTPTGAALVATLCRWGQPPLRLARVGIGYGTRPLPWPNALRLILGYPAEAANPPGARQVGADPRVRPAGDADQMQPIITELGLEQDTVTLLETNLDDLSPQVVAYTLEQVLAAGALDAWATPVQMKKGRPALVLSVLAAPETAPALAGILLRETTTLGVRYQTLDRVKAARRLLQVDMPFGPIQAKARRLGGAWTAEPEYEDCVAAARRTGQPLQAILAAVRAEAATIIAGWKGEEPG